MNVQKFMLKITRMLLQLKKFPFKLINFLEKYFQKKIKHYSKIKSDLPLMTPLVTCYLERKCPTRHIT